MATTTKPKFDFAQYVQTLTAQFKGLNPNDPSTWPLFPRVAACIALMVSLVVVLWFVWLQGSQDELQSAQAEEQKLKEEYKTKLGRAINLVMISRPAA